MGEVIGEHATHPEGVVPEVRAHEEGATRVGALGRLNQGRKRVEGLVVHRGDAAGAIAQPEVEEYARGVVGEHPILLARLE